MRGCRPGALAHPGEGAPVVGGLPPSLVHRPGLPSDRHSGDLEGVLPQQLRVGPLGRGALGHHHRLPQAKLGVAKASSRLNPSPLRPVPDVHPGGAGSPLLAQIVCPCAGFPLRPSGRRGIASTASAGARVEVHLQAGLALRPGAAVIISITCCRALRAVIRPSTTSRAIFRTLEGVFGSPNDRLAPVVQELMQELAQAELIGLPWTRPAGWCCNCSGAPSAAASAKTFSGSRPAQFDDDPHASRSDSSRISAMPLIFRR